MSRATRAKLSAARLAYARTGLTKAERELARAVAKVARARAKLAALQARAIRISSAAQKSRMTWAAIRAMAAQEHVPLSEARARHKEHLTAARAAAKHRPTTRFVWQASEGTEEYVFNLKTTVPDLSGRFPPNILALAHIRLEHWPAGMMQGTMHTELVTVPFHTGATFDEFWSNYHAAVRVFINAFLMARGIFDIRHKVTPVDTAYSIASIQAA